MRYLPARMYRISHEDVVSFRLPRELREELERERQRRSKRAGAEVKTSAVIRGFIEAGLKRAPGLKRSRQTVSP